MRKTLDGLPLPAWIVTIVLGIYLLGRLWPGLQAVWQLARGIGSRVKRGESPSTSRRRDFAQDVADRIRTLNQRARWSDERYPELEAEIETQGSRGSSNSIVGFLTGRRELRRERSLTDALADRRHRLVLLQGKGVALRHLALRQAEKAARSRRPDSVIRQSEEDAKRFVAERLLTAFEAVGAPAPPPPELWPVHNQMA